MRTTSLERVVRAVEQALRRPRYPAGRVFVESQQAILGREVEVAPFIQPVAFVGRGPTSATTPLPLTHTAPDASNQVRGWVDTVDPVAASQFSVTGVTAVTTQVVGQYFMGTRATANGADASWPSASLNPTPLFEVYAVLATMLCDATVATRTLTLDMISGLTSAVTLNQWQSTAVTLTASQSGSIFTASNRGTLLNDNGTITLDTVPGPCPFLMTDAGTLVANATTGQATDAVRVSFWARRVA